jgi:ABC-2 type transport system permease protein
MKRFFELLAVQLRIAVVLAARYRVDFFVDGVLSLFATATTLVPLIVVFSHRDFVEGWSFGEALVVTGWFTLLQGILDGAINPSLTQVVEQIRRGTLDFVLMKPVDAQFLVSTARILPWRATSTLNALVIFGYAFHKLGRVPSALEIGASLAMLAVAVTVLYAFWILTVSAAFYVVRVDNLTYLFDAVFDFGRWPIDVFRGFLSVIFRFVIPLAVMTTYPAEALLGRLGLTTFAASLAAAAVFFALSRAVWLRSLRAYGSASS